MAERRMFARTIIDSDAFLEMPQSTQLLYFHLSMRADDDGFINNPKSIMRNVGCKDDDMKVLVVKKFIIPFESGVVVIKHWRIHNYIQKDRKTDTKYKLELSMLELDENKAYRLPANNDKQLQDENVSKMDTQDRIGKDRIGKDRIGKDRLGKESIERETTKPYIKKTYLNHVYLLESNYQSMCSQYGKLNVDSAISSLDAYIANNDTRYTNKTDHDSIINKWLMRDACAGKIKIVKKDSHEPFRPLTDEERPSPERVHEILNQIPGLKYKEERMKKLEERRARADSS